MIINSLKPKNFLQNKIKDFDQSLDVEICKVSLRKMNCVLSRNSSWDLSFKLPKTWKEAISFEKKFEPKN